MDEIDFYLYDLKTKFDKIDYDKYYLSYSGGKDSHFLYWFIKEYLHDSRIEIVGCNTGMEHPEIRDRILKNSDRILIPTMKPLDIKREHGIPCFSKEQDFFIYYYQKAIRENKEIPKSIKNKIYGTHEKEFKIISKKAKKYIFSGNAHKITHKCCFFLKKQPFHIFEKESGKKPILGVRSSESALRRAQNATCLSKNGKFTPIHDLTDELLEKIIKKYNIEVPNVYNFINRTGCMGCPYGSYKHETEKELKLIKGNQKKYVINLFKESYEALGIKYYEEQYRLEE